MIKCDIIKDLLPGYADDVVSDETKKEVENHIKDCTVCKEELEQLKKPIGKTLPEKQEKQKINFLKKIKKRTWTKIAATAAVLIIVAAVLLQLFVWGTLVKSADMSFVLSRFQYEYQIIFSVDHNPDGGTITVDDDLSFLLVPSASTQNPYGILLILNNGRSLVLRSEIITDADGLVTQIILKPYQVVKSPLSKSNSAFFGVNLYNFKDGDINITIQFSDRDFILATSDFANIDAIQ